MKKLLYILSTALLVFASCSSDNDPILPDTGGNDNNNSGNNTKQTVTLNLKFASDMTTKSTANTADVQINQIVYAVFNEKNENDYGPALIQPSDDPQGYALFEFYDKVTVTDNTIPQITLELEEGNYYVAMLATSRTGEASTFFYGAAENEILGRTYFIVNGTDSPNEFTNTMRISVGNAPLEANMELNRAVGKVEIVITDLDELPNDILSISTRLESSINNYISPYLIGLTIDKFTGFLKSDMNVPVLSRDQFTNHGIENPISFYSLQTKNPFSLGGTFSSGGGLYLYLNRTTQDEDPKTSVNVNNRILISESLIVTPNKITRFTGRVTGDNVGFSLTVNDQWDDDVTVIPVQK